jgi:hypothetical protein
LLDRTQNRRWPRYSYDKSVCQISFQYVQFLQRKWTEIAIIEICRSPRGIMSVKNCSIIPKTEVNLDIFMINLYTKFLFNLCNQCKENERKLQVDRQTNRQQQSNALLSTNGSINIIHRCHACKQYICKNPYYCTCELYIL